MDYVYILAPLGLGVILTLCSTGYCMYIRYSKRKLTERIRRQMLAKMIGGPDASVQDFQWYPKMITNGISTYPIQPPSDIFVQKVGRELYASLTRTTPYMSNVPSQDQRNSTHYLSSKSRTQNTNLHKNNYYCNNEPERIYVNCPQKLRSEGESYRQQMRY
uniref:Uncharacterized protein n=1 Tax=Trichobilharzia regenti TaxID=157069 RepID=A0AA85JIW0_TRIRE|nr:unnamed protein product [Trichobilharzia regenti]